MLDSLNINELKKKRGVFIFSDPGGAKPILSFIKNNKLKNFTIFCDRYYNFFSYFNLKVNIFKVGDEDDILKIIKPDYIFTGTSYTSDIELRFIEKAKKLNIESFSYLDHYTSFKKRFLFKNFYLFPDNLLLLDKKAKEIANMQGITKFSNLFIVNNFYHDFLKKWIPKISYEKLYEKYQFPMKKKIILFAPDPLSNIDGKNKFNFDEIDVWNQLVDVLNNCNINNYFLAIKFHPNQNIKLLTNSIKDSNLNNVFFCDDNNSIDLIYYSEVIIGMFSSLLIEASIFKKKIIRHIPNETFVDPINHLKIGLVSRNKNDLFNNLRFTL